MRLYPLLFLSVGRAVPGSTCCRSAGPTATCCRRTEHEFGDHKLKSPNSPVFRDSPENTCRRCRPRLGEAPLRFALPQTPTEVCPPRMPPGKGGGISGVFPRSQQGAQRVHVLLAGGPAGDEAHDGVLRAAGLPDGELDPLGQRAHPLVGQHGKNLVGG